MKKILGLLVSILILCSFILSQDSDNNEVATLNQQLTNHYKKRDFEKAYPIAERIVEIQRNQKKIDELAVSLKNLAIVLKNYDENLQRELTAKSTSEDRKSKIRSIKRGFTEDISKHFKEAIEIYEKKLKVENLQLAEAKFEYALYLNRSQVILPTTSSDSEKSEKLLNDSLKIRKKILGENDDLFLYTLVTTANFNYINANFENSFVQYENYIERVKNKHGKDSPFLLTALRNLSQLYVAIGYRTKALNLAKQLSKISKESEVLIIHGLNLTKRNEDNAVEKLSLNFSKVSSEPKEQKWIPVIVTISKKGKVKEAFVEDITGKETFEQEITRKVIKDVKKWKFRPLIYKGKKRTVAGIVYYPYFSK